MSRVAHRSIFSDYSLDAHAFSTRQGRRRQVSQPERYEPRARSIGGPWKMVKCKDGPYVCHEQHAEIVAALAADKQAADRATFDAIRAFTVLKEDYAALAAENERLRKAGDVMAAIIRPPAHGPGEWDGEYDAWHAAKEGK